MDLWSVDQLLDLVMESAQQVGRMPSTMMSMNQSYVNESLLLGQLHGNRFTITLRGVVANSEDTVKVATNALGKHGFVNYFGMQRFGSGAKLLKGEWKEAVSMILDPRDGDILLVSDIII
ncbi:hypothetical protein Lser_V15G11646 [Lactuca serriola]